MMRAARHLLVLGLLFMAGPLPAQVPPASNEPAEPAPRWDKDREWAQFMRLFGEAPSKWRHTEYDPRAVRDAPLGSELVLPMPCNGAMVFRRIEVGGGPGWLGEQRIELGSSDESQAPVDYRHPEYIAGAFRDTARDPAAGRYYYLGKYEVTRLQYRVLSGSCPQRLKGRRPVVGVSWYDAVEFTRRYTEWLYQNARDQLPTVDGVPGYLRLPTEVEWEYAARGGLAVDAAAFRGKLFPMGEGSIEDYAWIRESVSSSFQPRPIGSLEANPLGLYDVLGNAAELVFDLFRLSGRGRMHGQAGGFVVKGGHFRSWGNRLSTSWRREHPQFSQRTGTPTRLDTVGFRVAISAPVLTSEQRLKAIREEWRRQAEELPVPAFPQPPLPRIEPPAPLPEWIRIRALLQDMDSAQIRRYGVWFLQAGDPDRALLLFKKAARQGDAWAALAIGALYDPLLFESENFDRRQTPFSKPNPGMARCWYQVARSLGETQARARIKTLDARRRPASAAAAEAPPRAKASCEQVTRQYGVRQVQ